MKQVSKITKIESYFGYSNYVTVLDITFEGAKYENFRYNQLGTILSFRTKQNIYDFDFWYNWKNNQGNVMKLPRLKYLFGGSK